MFNLLSKETALAVRLIALAVSGVLLFFAVASFIGLAEASDSITAVLAIASFVLWLVASVLGVLISEEHFATRSDNYLPMLDLSGDDLTSSELE